MGSEHARAFWQDRDEYHDLARQFERNIEVVHPDTVTSDGRCTAGHLMHRCTWCRTSVCYLEHRP